MTTKFIVDSLKEKDRKKLELIKKTVDEKSVKISKETKFLRKFTLAILQQYNKELKFISEKRFNEKLIDYNLPKIPDKIKLNIKMPEAPSPIKLKIDLNVPEKLKI